MGKRFILLFMFLNLIVYSAPSIFEKIGTGFYCFRDDNGETEVRQWYTSSIQNVYAQQIKKIIDTTSLPKEIWDKTESVFLSIYITSYDISSKRDYSENFEIVINGKIHKFSTKILPHPNHLSWMDFYFDKNEFVYGINEIIIRKEEGSKDNHIYVGIDTSSNRGNSKASYDGGKTWGDELNIHYRVKGEYLIRLYAITEEAEKFKVEFDKEKGLIDHSKIVKFFGSKTWEDKKNVLEDGEELRIEWWYKNIDRNYPLKIRFEGDGKISFKILDEEGKPFETAELNLPFEKDYKGNSISGIIVKSIGKTEINKIIISGRKLDYPEEEKVIPFSSEPKGKAIKGRLAFYLSGNKYCFENEGLKAKLEVNKNKLKFISLYNEYTKTEMIKDPSKIYIFAVEIGDKILKGTEDFLCTEIKEKKNGLGIEMINEKENIEANLEVKIDKEGLIMFLSLKNNGDDKVIKVAFPYIQGLSVSEKIENDYYFYPIIDYEGGPIIGKEPIYIRSGYGTNQLGFQVIDIYSPERGGGLYLRIDDREGWIKIFSLKKKEGKGLKRNVLWDDKTYDISEELRWKNEILEDVEGFGLSCEYQGKRFKKGDIIKISPGIISSHPKDWKEVMKIYSQWAHNVWKYRPYPNKLTNTWNHLCFGSTSGKLTLKDDEYIKKIVLSTEDRNPIEIWFWWEWSKLGPWKKAIEEYTKEGSTFDQWSFHKHPKTEELMFFDNTGDYDYAEALGGKEGLKEAVEKYHRVGRLLTFYTDVFRLYDVTKTGEKYGEKWCTLKSDNNFLEKYEAFVPCIYNEEYQKWVGETMKRVIEDTDIDGIRYDEGGLAGYTCYSEKHQHKYCEKGELQWNKAFSEICKLTREKVSRDFTLTTEFPGYDYLLQFLDGCITHTYVYLGSKGDKPIEVNLIRFYFPEVKCYDISPNHIPAEFKEKSLKKILWNGIGKFNNWGEDKFRKIFMEYSEILSSNDCEPFLPSLKKGIYVNRFTKDGKSIFTIYNTNKFTSKGPILEIELKGDEEIVDIINNQPVEIERIGKDKAIVKIYIEREDVACILKKKK